MKRNPVLQPLSREHHSALVLAKACERAAQSADAAIVNLACRRAILAFENELDAHFRIEEESLLPLLKSTYSQALLQRTLKEHEQLRGLLIGLQQNDAQALGSFGKLLSAHVRFEERELFPVIEGLI